MSVVMADEMNFRNCSGCLSRTWQSGFEPVPDAPLRVSPFRIVKSPPDGNGVNI